MNNNIPSALNQRGKHQYSCQLLWKFYGVDKNGNRANQPYEAETKPAKWWNSEIIVRKADKGSALVVMTKKDKNSRGAKYNSMTRAISCPLENLC